MDIGWVRNGQLCVQILLKEYHILVQCLQDNQQNRGFFNISENPKSKGISNPFKNPGWSENQFFITAELKTSQGNFSDKESGVK